MRGRSAIVPGATYLTGLLLLAACGASTDPGVAQPPLSCSTTEAGSGEVAVDAAPEASVDVGLPEALDPTPRDAAPDSAPDLDGPREAAADASTEMTRDAGGEVGDEVSFDAPAEPAPDAADALTSDGPEDAATDTSGDVVDVTIDAAPACSDRTQNGDETDVDCGGSCPACTPNKHCLVDADCSPSASGCDAANGGCACDTASMRCVYNHCFDNKLDQGETGTDCGGGTCAACAVGLPCKVDSDCASSACDALSHLCARDTCLDHHQDRNESDIDCGGNDFACARCAPGKKCTSNIDCEAYLLCSNGSPRVCQ